MTQKKVACFTCILITSLELSYIMIIRWPCLSAVHITREHGPCPRAVRTVRGHGWRILSPVHTDRGLDTVRAHGTPFTLPVSTGRVQHGCQKALHDQCFLTPVLSTVRGHGSLHGARFTVHTTRAHGRVHGSCARVTKFATRVHGPCARSVDTGRVHG